MENLVGYNTQKLLFSSDKGLFYKGYRESDRMPVLLKYLKKDHASSYNHHNLQQEYEISRHLDTNGIFKPYSIENTPNGPVLVLEYFDGIPFKKTLPEGGMDLGLFLKMAIQATKSLNELHRLNILHQGISSHNLIMDLKTGEVKLTDIAFPPTINPSHDQSAGTDFLDYIAPEQTGRMSIAVDYRTDYYSLGICLYEALTGQLPFSSEDPLELIHFHLAKMPVPPHKLNARIPKTLSEIVIKLLAKNIEDRYQSANGLLHDLEKCQDQLLKTGRIENFTPGQSDIATNLFTSHKLYGRETELAQIQQIIDRVRSGGKAEVLTISGSSGLGKTSLIREIQNLNAGKNGYFVSGKFDQIKSDTPYSAGIQAFNELYARILMEPEESLAHWRKELTEAINPNGQVLAEINPNLELIIGKQPPVEPLPPAEAQNRLNLVFLNFMRVIARKDHPLVIFLDDVQWIDPATIALTQFILTSGLMDSFLFIAAYRKEDTLSGHPFLKMVEEISRSGTQINQIALKRIDPSDGKTMVGDILNYQGEEIEPLANIVIQKTGGNPYFIREFLMSLHKEKLLYFDLESSRWLWDEHKIMAKQASSDIEELLVEKIRNLPHETQHILKVASSIGNKFDLTQLITLLSPSVRETQMNLQSAVDNGLILTSIRQYSFLSDNAAHEYKFAHDRVQQAVYSLIPEKDRAQWHLKIGQQMLHSLSRDELEQKIFDVTNQLNSGITDIPPSAVNDMMSAEEKAQLIALNIKAAKKAKGNVAYKAALNYLSMAIRLLDELCWQDQYDTALHLYTEATEAAYLSTEFSLMEENAGIVLEHARNLLDKIKIYEIRVQAYMSQNNMTHAVETTLHALKLLNIHLPANPSLLHVLSGFIGSKILLFRSLTLKGLEIEDLNSLPLMTDPNKLAAVSLMKNASGAIYVSSPMLFPLLMFKQLELQIRYGNAGSGYSGYGMILSSVMGDIDAGYRFGKLNMQMMDKNKLKLLKPHLYSTFNTFLRHWKEPLRNSLPQLAQTYEASIETGDFEYGGYSLFQHTLMLYCMGDQLDHLNLVMEQNAEKLYPMKWQTTTNYLKMYHQSVVKLMEPSKDISGTTFSGTLYREEDLLPVHRETKDLFALFSLNFIKAQHSYLFHQYSAAADFSAEAKKHASGALGFAIVPIANFYDSLANLATYSDASASKKRKILRLVSGNQKKLKKWAGHAPENRLHQYYLVEAEKCRIIGLDSKAEEYYAKAIKLAQENQFIHEEGIGHELAANFYLTKTKTNQAKSHIQEAYRCFETWGAAGKVRDMETTYSALLDSPQNINYGLSVSDSIDLNTILKSAMAISGEINLEKLLTRLMKVLLENAGATRCVLILKKDGRFFVEAEGDTHDNGIRIFSLPLNETSSLPTGIVNYVIRTNEKMVLDNAITEGIFVHDPYVISKGLKSILCAPIQNKGKLTGILYLENTLTKSAFTRDRLNVLDMLSAQIAISIENARLYESLEHKVEERTQELKNINKQLSEEITVRKKVEKDLEEVKNAAIEASRAKSEFLTNMSHEIRTPMNTTIGLADLLRETDLTDEQSRYVDMFHKSGEHLLNLINDILDLSKIEAGHMELEHIDFNLLKMIEKAQEMISLKAKEKNIKLTSYIDPEIEKLGYLTGDPHRLNQILINLMSNSLKFTKKGEIGVNVSIKEKNEKRVTLLFEVRDTGIGIPEDKMAKLFQNFTQVDSSTTRQYGGTGLGLAISKKLTEMMNGSIWVTSKVGEGSSFCFTAEFGLSQRPILTKTKQGLSDTELRDKLSSRKLNLLLVEDSGDNREIFMLYIKGFNYHTDVAENGEVALEKLKNKNYDIVFMDTQMPIMDGYAATSLYREWEAANRKTLTPIIGLSANAFKDDAERAIQAGCTAYLSKPVRKNKLLETIGEYI